MGVPLAHQAQNLLGQSALVIIPERGDDGALRSGQMVKMGGGEVLDRPLPRHGKPRRGSWGGTAGLGLASILTEGDHRKVSGAADSTGMHHTLSPLPGQRLAPLDVRDDRWGHLLTPLRQPTSGHGSAEDVHARRLAGSAWLQDVIRCEATTGAGAHDVTAGGLWPLGPRNDAPTRPHIKVMRGSLAPWGRPLATEGRAGERAEEGLDLPLIKRLEALAAPKRCAVRRRWHDARVGHPGAYGGAPARGLGTVAVHRGDGCGQGGMAPRGGGARRGRCAGTDVSHA